MLSPKVRPHAEDPDIVVVDWRGYDVAFKPAPGIPLNRFAAPAAFSLVEAAHPPEYVYRLREDFHNTHDRRVALHVGRHIDGKRAIEAALVAKLTPLLEEYR